LRKSVLAFCLLLAGPLIGPVAAGSWTGKASYYDYKGRTASGQKPGTLTAAHRTLPFGTRLKVTNLKNNKSTLVIVSDRGPFIPSRIVDVSRAAAETLGFKDKGVSEVRIETIGQGIAVARVIPVEADMDLTK
jgi:peptidoglycan lytic transglycosylase